MTPDMWWLLSCALAVVAVVFAGRTAINAARRDFAAAVLLASLTEPPAPGETAAGFLPPPAADPQPRVPGHHHGHLAAVVRYHNPGTGRLTCTLRFFADGCSDLHDPTWRLLWASYPGAGDLRQWDQEMEDT